MPARRLTRSVACLSLSWLLISCRSWTLEEVNLSGLDLEKMSSRRDKPQVNLSCKGEPLSIGGRAFDRGVGVHADSVMHVRLDGAAGRFRALVGVDDGAGAEATVRFKVYTDNRVAFDSGVRHSGEPAVPVDVRLDDVEHLILLASSTGDGSESDCADWAEARFTYAGARPRAVERPTIEEERVILTPKPGPAPVINGPKVLGGRPGRPFVYRVPCTGDRPLRFAARNLPPGLVLDAASGVVRGSLPKRRGEYPVSFTATNSQGTDEQNIRLVVGDSLALTPPMGWNSWYIHYQRVTEQHLREAAEVMVSSGMTDVGYQYVNIDDCWMKQRGDEPYRDARGAVLPNAKFPDIEGMIEYIHGKGLRAGTYISPGPWTCAGYVGSHQHEQIDAGKFAEWGFDFLKYDWCSYRDVATGEGLERLQAPYRQMGDILKQLGRDIVLNLCQYGMGEVWRWGGEVGGNCWRTTGDLGLERGALLPGFYSIGLSNAQHWEFAKPGQWNDPDYLLIGWVGDAHREGEGEPTSLTPNEQYSYMSMWCLMAAPLFFSGDMSRLDDFTLNVLCNPEVIELDQDPLGKQARPVRQDEETLILAKAMEDGSLAVGLFNLEEFQRPITVTWEELGLQGRQRVRDVWRHQDLGEFDGHYGTDVARHGVMLVRLSAVR